MTIGGGWGGRRQGFGVPRGGYGDGVCFGTPKCRDCVRVSAGKLPNSDGGQGGVCSPRLRVALSDFGQIAELL